MMSLRSDRLIILGRKGEKKAAKGRTCSEKGEKMVLNLKGQEKGEHHCIYTNYYFIKGQKRANKGEKGRDLPPFFALFDPFLTFSHHIIS
jgi:hypothetical protein